MVIPPVEPRTVDLHIPTRPPEHALTRTPPGPQVLDHAAVVLRHRLDEITEGLLALQGMDQHAYLDAVNAITSDLNAAVLDHRYAVVRGEFTPTPGTVPPVTPTLWPTAAVPA